jgi:hypothetical protein
MAAALGTSIATAADQPVVAPAPEASIPFANHDGIYDWQADGTKGIWVQGANRRWYYGKFMSSCIGLDFAIAVGFVTGPSGSFDKWSYLLVRDGGRCHFTSFTASNGPPAKPRAKADKADKADKAEKAEKADK